MDHEWDGLFQDPTTGFSLTQYRAYDPNLRRWLSRDPLGRAGSGGNLYGYVGDNPITYSDPYGLFGWADLGLPQWVVNGSTGFGDGAYHAVTFGFGNLQQIRDLLDISNGGANPCSRDYRGAYWAGGVDGSGAIGGALLRQAAELSQFLPFRWLNNNRYVRIGPGKPGPTQPKVPMLRFGTSPGNIRDSSGNFSPTKTWWTHWRL